nr:DinB family protein [Pelagibacterium limicola]
MDSALRVFTKLAVNNALANLRLAQAVASLSQADFEAPRTGFFPSLKATLNHILIIDWFYIDAIRGGTLGPQAWADETPFGDAASLYVAQRKSDLQLFAFCQGLAPHDLAAPVHLHRQSRIQTERLDDVLSHLFQHQTHHRGQAHAMLSGTPTAPPQLDEFITADDAKFRSEELSAFGWDETALGF